ncbi:MAG: restriction endonuclease subunit S [Eubacteriales bacterium]|nr:restriction endonuclease subunit S [Eubacteriales bacterium]
MPAGWSWARIFSITEELPYGTAKKSSPTGLVAVLRMGNIQSGEIDYSDLVYSSDRDDIVKYTLIKNDLLFNRTNSAEWVGKTAIYRGNMPAIYAGYLIRIRTFINAEYLNVVMNSGYAKSYCNSVKTDGVNQSNINAQKLGNFLVPIPSFGEQHRISSNIADILPRISIIQDEKDYITDLIQKTKSKILDLAIRGKLVPQNPDDEPASVLLDRIRAEKEELINQGKIKRDKKESVIFRGEDNSYYDDIPDGWEICYLGELFNVCSAKRVKQSDWRTEGVPFYRAREIVKLSNNDFVDNELYISEDHYQQVKKEYGIPQPGDLMVSGVGTIGKVYVVKDTDHFYYKDASVLCFENRNGIIDSQYAKYMLMSEFIQNQMRENSKGTTVDTITISAAMNYICFVPPANEQKRIVSAIEQILNHLKIIELALL